MVDPAVLRRFSAGAARYEAHAHAQRLSAVDLLAYTKEWFPASWGADGHGRPSADGHGRPSAEAVKDDHGSCDASAAAGRDAPGVVAAAGDRFTILEPGCGTGLYTRMLLGAFPAASILGVDVSEAMIRVARKQMDDPRARFSVADAEEIVTGSYDLVTSNAAFQWFLSLPRTLARMASLLGGGGLLTFSFFGPETFAELDDALRAAAGRDAPDMVAAAGGSHVAATAFHTREEISSAISAAFPRWEVSERRYQQEFPTLADLLRSIRYTGTRGGGAGEPWSPGKLARVEAAYRERAGGIKATYQVFLCRGVVHEGGAG